MINEDGEDLKFYTCVCIYTYNTGMSQCLCGGQKTTQGKCVSPSTMWVLGFKFRSSDLVVVSLPVEPSCLPRTESNTFLNFSFPCSVFILLSYQEKHKEYLYF